jgi:hypothetical protein
LDSGGTYCYRPFYKGFKIHLGNNDNDNRSNGDVNNNSSNSDNDDNNNPVRNDNQFSEALNNINNNNINNNSNNDGSSSNNNNNSNNDVSLPTRNLNENPEIPETFQPRVVPTDNARRRLYVDLDRPRPFYGRTGAPGRPIRNFLVSTLQNFFPSPLTLRKNENKLECFFLESFSGAVLQSLLTFFVWGRGVGVGGSGFEPREKDTEKDLVKFGLDQIQALGKLKCLSLANLMGLA